MFPKNCIFAIVLIGLTGYMLANKDYFIREHLANKNPTLFSLQKDLDATNEELQALSKDYQDLKQRGQAQSAQAAGAMASLKAIPAASPNTVIPTR